MKTLAIYRESPQRWSLLEIEDRIVTSDPRVVTAHRVAGPLSRRELDRVLAERVATSTSLRCHDDVMRIATDATDETKETSENPGK